MTRKQYLQQEVETLVNDFILPKLKEKKLTPDEIKQINFNGFLYTVDRIPPLIWLIYTASYLTEEEINQIKKDYELQTEAKININKEDK